MSTSDDVDVDLWIDPTGDAVTQLIDHAAILSHEAQWAFANAYSAYSSWRVDFSDPAAFWFEREPPATFHPHFLGSTAISENSWMWGWNNINDFPPDVIGIAEQVFRVGHQLGIAELTEPFHDLNDSSRRHPILTTLPQPEYGYVLIAQAVSGLAAPVYYRGPAGTTYTWLLLDNPAEFSLVPPTALTAITTITSALSAPAVTNHRLAITAYARRRSGLRIIDDTAASLTIGAPDGAVVASFDSGDRLISLESPGMSH